MEKAIYITKFEKLNTAGECDRVYFGAEFCEKKLPPTKIILEAIKITANAGAGFSLLTPYLSEKGLVRIKKLLAGLPEDAGIEVIINDFGTLMFLRDERPDLEPVLGRLLAKQKKGVGISTRKDDAPPALLRQWGYSAFDNAAVREHLKGFGVKRVELDNLVQDITSNLSGSGLSGSIYYPYAAVTTSVACGFCGTGTSGPGCFGGIIEDKGELFDRTVYTSGNARFFQNDDLPQEDKLKAIGIDRIICEPDLPV